MTDFNREEAITQLGAAMMEFAMMMQPVRAAVAGYRETLVREGWSKEAAEEMSVHYHGFLCKAIGSNLGGK